MVDTCVCLYHNLPQKSLNQLTDFHETLHEIATSTNMAVVRTTEL
jgi:hypothetical protein